MWMVGKSQGNSPSLTVLGTHSYDHVPVLTREAVCRGHRPLRTPLWDQRPPFGCHAVRSPIASNKTSAQPAGVH